MIPSDHDLLIELRTEMRGLRSEVREMRDDSSRRINALEISKIDKDEVHRHWATTDTDHEDLWRQINWLKGIAYAGIGILTMIQIYFRLIT